MRDQPKHVAKRGPDGEPAIDQGLVHGFPCTYNPDDSRFYVHAKGAADGTAVLGGFIDWKSAVQYARKCAVREARGGGAPGAPPAGVMKTPRGKPRTDAEGNVLQDQGEVNGFPVTYENGRFTIWPPHYMQEQGDTAPMAARGSWSNAVGYIREIAPLPPPRLRPPPAAEGKEA